jgi:hypothetical protein
MFDEMLKVIIKSLHILSTIKYIGNCIILDLNFREICFDEEYILGKCEVI